MGAGRPIATPRVPCSGQSSSCPSLLDSGTGACSPVLTLGLRRTGRTSSAALLLLLLLMLLVLLLLLLPLPLPPPPPLLPPLLPPPP